MFRLRTQLSPWDSTSVKWKISDGIWPRKRPKRARATGDKQSARSWTKRHRAGRAGHGAVRQLRASAAGQWREQRLRDCQAMSEPSVARHRPLDRDLSANLNDRVTRKWDGRTGRLRAGRVSAPLDSKKVLGVLFLDLYCVFHSASQVHRQASSGMSESCP
jgi:hypothetical protein